MKYLIILVLLIGCGEITPINITYRDFNSFPECGEKYLKENKTQVLQQREGVLHFNPRAGYLCKVLHEN